MKWISFITCCVLSLCAQALDVYPAQPTGISIVNDQGVGEPVAITFGATTSISCKTASGNNQDTAHTTDAGTDVVLALMSGYSGGNGVLSNWITGVEWIKTGETAQAATNFTPGAYWTDEQLSASTVASPDIGAGNFRADIQYAADDGVQIVVANLIGVDTTVGTDGVRNTSENSQGSGTSINMDVTTVPGDVVVVILYTGDSDATLGTGLTAIYEDQLCNDAYTTLAYKTATSTTTNVEFTSISGYTAIFALVFAPSAEPATTSLPPINRHNVFSHLLVR